MAFEHLWMMVAAFVAQDARPSPSLQAKFESRYAAMKTAMGNKDAAALRSMLGPGFMSVDATGKTEDAAHMLKEVLALPADPSRQSRTTILSITGDDHVAVVKQRYEMTKTAIAPDGSEKSVALSTLSTDKWVNQNGSWRIVRTVTNQLDYTVDGVTVAHQVNRTHR
jgi:hypothetical protein